MKRITESSAIAIQGSWTAQNYALAVELEKKAARQIASKTDVEAFPQWFSPEFADKVLAIAFDTQTEVGSLIDNLLDLPKLSCNLLSWRYLHDFIDSALPQYPDSAFETKRLRLLDAIEVKWRYLISVWNKLPTKQKAAINIRYKALLELFVDSDFGPNAISIEEQDRLDDLNIDLCDKVIEEVKRLLSKKMRPVHLYALVETLEHFEFVPKRKRLLITRLLGSRHGINVKANYRPDPSEHRYKDSDGRGNAVVASSLAIEATNEALVQLHLRPKGYNEYYRGL